MRFRQPLSQTRLQSQTIASISDRPPARAAARRRAPAAGGRRRRTRPGRASRARRAAVRARRPPASTSGAGTKRSRRRPAASGAASRDARGVEPETGAAPSSRSSAGRTKRRKATITDAGLPGRPKTSVSPRRANERAACRAGWRRRGTRSLAAERARGRPAGGRRRPSRRRRRCRTTSAPPSSAPARRAASSSGSSRADRRASRDARPSRRPAAEQEVGVRVAQLRRGRRRLGRDDFVAGGEHRDARRARRPRARSSALAGERARAPPAPSRAPAGEELGARRDDLAPAADRVAAPAALRRSRTRPSPAGSVSSMPTTRSAPAGTGAPVLIRSAAPAGEPAPGASPAATVPADRELRARRDLAGEGEAVERRDVVAGQVGGGGERRGEHAAERLAPRHAARRRAALGRGLDLSPGVLGREHAASSRISAARAGRQPGRAAACGRRRRLRVRIRASP